MSPSKHPPTLSSSSIPPSIRDRQPLPGSASCLSLSEFLAEDHPELNASLASTALHRPSSTHLSTTSTSSRPNIDDILARCASVASKLAFNRGSEQTGFDLNTRDSRSSTTREVMVEVSGDLRETHEALMRCLYAPEDEIRDARGAEAENSGYRWSPSGEQLKGLYGKTVDENEDDEGDMARTSGETEYGVATLAQMRGGGLQEFFGLKKRPSEEKSLPKRPDIISRPSDAFKGPDELSKPASQPLEQPQIAPMVLQSSRIQRVQQMESLGPPSMSFSLGSSSLADSGRTASIVPESTIASFYMGPQRRPDTLHLSSNSRVSVCDFPSTQSPSSTKKHSEALPSKHSPANSDRSESTVHNAPLTVELPTTELQEPWDDNSPTIKPLVDETRELHLEEISSVGMRQVGPGEVRKLGSPMHSPIRDAWDSDGKSPSSPGRHDSSQPPSSRYGMDPQTMFFAPQSREDLPRSVAGSLRKNRRPVGQRPVTSRPPPPVTEQNIRPYLFPPGTALSSGFAQPTDDRLAPEMPEVNPSNYSIWHGGGHLSIAPEDSASEAGRKDQQRVPNAIQAQKYPTQHPSKRDKFLSGGALTEVGEERHEMVEGAKEKSEDRFRDEVRRVWSSYQARMRMISGDPMKTPAEKEKAVKEEHRILELLIAQASTDTGFEQLHEPWQKDDFVRAMFGIRPKTSRAPSILRKANKVMKWVLAVPDDPALKTWSSRRSGPGYSRLDVASSKLQNQNRPGNTTSSRSPGIQVQRMATSDGEPRQQEGGIAPSPEPNTNSNPHRHFHFAPSPPPPPPANAHVWHQAGFETQGRSSQSSPVQGKTGKMDYGQSAASSETGWPTQSQMNGA